jgi:hypothetical protein
MLRQTCRLLAQDVSANYLQPDTNGVEKTSYFGGWSARQTFSGVSGRS